MKAMNRRFFLTSALASPLLAALPGVAADVAPSSARRGFHVPAGRARDERPMRLGGATPTDTKISTADTQGSFYLFEHRRMGRGGPPRHFHHAQDEFFFVIEGEFLFEVGDERFRLGAGDTVFLPRTVPHVWAHVGRKPGTILGAVTPAGDFERFFHAVAAHSSPLGNEEAVALFAAHGMEIVGPPLPLED